MKPHRYYFAAAGLALLLALGAAPWGNTEEISDHDRARQALEAGEVLPLRTVLERVERQYPGQIMEVELEREDGILVYEIKLLRPGGALMKLEVDARNGNIIKSKSREARDGGKKGGH